MLDFLLSPEILVWIAGGLYAIGYLIINQFILRLLVLIGTGFYIWYYFVIADAPLWEAVITSVVLGTANVIGMANLTLSKSKYAVPREHRDIYQKFFRAMPPGDFRDLMRLGRREIAQSERIITIENAPVQNLYFIVAGDLTIEKRGEVFTMPPGLFVGEIAYLTREKSSATTRVPEGSEVLVWNFNDLRRRSERKPHFKMALESVISRDLAVKVAFAVAPHESWSPDEVTARLVQA